jgi:hypothetical protein
MNKLYLSLILLSASAGLSAMNEKINEKKLTKSSHRKHKNVSTFNPLASEDVLFEQLTKAGYRDFAEKTNLHKELAGQKKSSEDIAQAIDLRFLPHYFENNKENPGLVPFYKMHRPHIVATILAARSSCKTADI